MYSLWAEKHANTETMAAAPSLCITVGPYVVVTAHPSSPPGGPSIRAVSRGSHYDRRPVYSPAAWWPGLMSLERTAATRTDGWPATHRVSTAPPMDAPTVRGNNNDSSWFCFYQRMITTRQSSAVGSDRFDASGFIHRTHDVITIFVSRRQGGFPPLSQASPGFRVQHPPRARWVLQSQFGPRWQPHPWVRTWFLCRLGSDRL